MAKWLDMLVSGLAGGAQSGAGYLRGQREQRERDAERQANEAFRQAQLDLQRQQFAAQQFDRRRAREQERFGAMDANANLSPEDVAIGKELGIAMRPIASKPGAKVSDTFSLPDLPTYGLTEAPGADLSLPPSLPKPVEGAPLSVATPTFGMGEGPQTRRAFTPKEQADTIAQSRLKAAIDEARANGLEGLAVALGASEFMGGVPADLTKTPAQIKAEAEDNLQREIRFIEAQEAARSRGRVDSMGEGRPVVSGTTRQLAELISSLDDVKVLAEKVTGEGDTGTVSKLEAWSPNWFTELTGIGEDAKQRQATIDRVKQAIGKALEGGVLRKEDEIKYTKILPTIYDTPAVVRDKLVGLDQAIRQRYTNELDALEDAGYSVREYRQRFANRPPLTFPNEQSVEVPPQVLAAGPGEHEFANGQVWLVSEDGKTAQRIR